MAAAASPSEPGACHLRSELEDVKTSAVMKAGTNSIGNLPTGDIGLPAFCVSTRRVVLESINGAVVVVAAGSENGDFVNGGGGERAKLRLSNWVQPGPAALHIERAFFSDAELGIAVEQGSPGAKPRTPNDEAGGRAVNHLRACERWTPRLNRVSAVLFDQAEPDLPRIPADRGARLAAESVSPPGWSAKPSSLVAASGGQLTVAPGGDQIPPWFAEAIRNKSSATPHQITPQWITLVPGNTG